MKVMFSESLPFAICTLCVTQPLTCLGYLLLDFTLKSAAYRGDCRPIHHPDSSSGSDVRLVLGIFQFASVFVSWPSSPTSNKPASTS
jgi:hypothetical protein